MHEERRNRPISGPPRDDYWIAAGALIALVSMGVFVLVGVVGVFVGAWQLFGLIVDALQ